MAISEELKLVIKAEARKAVNELKKVKRGAEKVEKSAKDMTNSLKFLKSAAVVGAITLVGRKLMSVVATSIKAAGTFEKQKVAFEVLLGSVSKANKLLGEIRTFAAATPFTTMGLIQGSQQLLSYGAAAETIIDVMKRLGDVAMGDQNKLNRLVLAFGKVKSKGRASLEELNLFMEAGVPILEELSKNYGVTTQEMFKMISAGKIGFDDINKALKTMTSSGGKFFKMGEKIAKTYEGLLSTFQSNVEELQIAFGELLIPFLVEMLPKLTEFIRSLTEIVGERDKLVALRKKEREEGVKSLTVDERIFLLKKNIEGLQRWQGGRGAIINKKRIAQLKEQMGYLRRLKDGQKEVAKAIGKTSAPIIKLTEAQLLFAKVQNQVADALQAISQQAVLYGDEFDYAAARTEILKGAIDALLESGLGFTALSPAIKEFADQLERAGAVSLIAIGGAAPAGVGAPLPAGMGPSPPGVGAQMQALGAREAGPTGLPPTMVGIPAPTGIGELGKAAAGGVQEMLIATREIMSDMERMDMDFMAESLKKAKDEAESLKAALEAAAETMEDKLVAAAKEFHKAFAEGLGQMIVGTEDAAEAMKEAFKGFIVTALEALAQQFMAMAAGYLFFNPAAAVALFAAATGAYVAAGVVQALHEGGFVQKSGLFALEKGEAVVSKDRAPGGITINQYVQGSVLSERQLERLAVSAIAKAGRGY